MSNLKLFNLFGLIAILIITCFLFGCLLGDDIDTIREKAGLRALTGTVIITGSALVGQTLTAATTDLGGSGTISY